MCANNITLMLAGFGTLVAFYWIVRLGIIALIGVWIALEIRRGSR